jgi:hypothetical protein
VSAQPDEYDEVDWGPDDEAFFEDLTHFFANVKNKVARAEETDRLLNEFVRKCDEVSRHDSAMRDAEVARVKTLRLSRAENPNGAACSTHDHPEWFWDPQDKSEFVRASAVCRHACPRAAECLSEAMRNGSEWGVHGGIWFVDGQPTRRFHVSNVA